MTPPTNAALQMRDLSIGYISGNESSAVHSHLSLELKRGEMVCLVGPNGSGKSTLLRTIAGLQPSLSGHVLIEGRDISALPPLALAHLRSVVLTQRFDAGYMTVYELAALGRFPHLGWLGRLGRHDRKVVSDALALTGIGHLGERKLLSLSDGELQRAMIAKALAQQAPVIVLDEPTAHLDLPNRVAVMKLLQRLAKETGSAIVLSTHELDLAMQSADRFWLMYAQDEIRCGPPEQLALAGDIARAFNSENVHFDSSSGIFVMDNQRKGTVMLHGTGDEYFWTKRLLERIGYRIGDSNVCVSVHTSSGSISWSVCGGCSEQYAHSMDMLADILK